MQKNWKKYLLLLGAHPVFSYKLEHSILASFTTFHILSINNKSPLQGLIWWVFLYTRAFPIPATCLFYINFLIPCKTEFIKLFFFFTVISKNESHFKIWTSSVYSLLHPYPIPSLSSKQKFNITLFVHLTISYPLSWQCNRSPSAGTILPCEKQLDRKDSEMRSGEKEAASWFGLYKMTHPSLPIHLKPSMARSKKKDACSVYNESKYHIPLSLLSPTGRMLAWECQSLSKRESSDGYLEHRNRDRVSSKGPRLMDK